MPRDPNCTACHGRGFVVIGSKWPPEIGTLNSAELAVARHRHLDAPRAHCPDGCEPYHWDVARLDADAKRLPAQKAAA